MPTYTILTQNIKRDFDLYYGETLAARFVFPKWYSGNCTITIADKEYRLVGQGLWKRKYMLYIGEQEVASYVPGFGKCTITPRMEAHHFYHIKRKGGFNAGYKLVNYKEEPLAEITQRVNWKKFRTVYDITIIKDIQPKGQMDFIGLLFMVKYAIEMQRAAAAAAQ